MNKPVTLALATFALLLSGCTSVLSKHAVGNTAVPQPAKSVELSRYLGHWYELARYEQGFQKDCDGVNADYALRPRQDFRPEQMPQTRWLAQIR